MSHWSEEIDEENYQELIGENTELKEKVELYEKTIKQIIDRQYEKEMIFLDDIGIYSRHDAKHITPKELCNFVLEITKED